MIVTGHNHSPLCDVAVFFVKNYHGKVYGCNNENERFGLTADLE